MRALQDFEPLFPAEQKLLNEVSGGGTCWITTARPATPAPTNEIRAAFIRFLALGGDARAYVQESGVRLRGAYINGAITLDGANDIRPLWLEDCFISSRISFFDARTKVIGLDGSSVQAIRGDRAKIDGSLLLRRGFVCEGSIRLSGAEIDGTLACEGSTIKGAPWRWQKLALDLATATINGNVEFSRGFTAHGLISLDDAEIGGLFDCTGGRFHAAPGEKKPPQAEPWDAGLRAIKCHRLILGGSLYLRDASCDGEISFSGAEIGGDLDCRRGRFHAAGDGEAIALRFTRVDVGGNVYLSGGFESFGKVQLNGAVIRGNVDCHGGVFTIPAGIGATDLAAPGDAFSEDCLSLVNAEIGGALMFAPPDLKNGGSAIFNGSLDLKSAKVPVLVDTPAAWPQKALRHRPGELRDVIHLDGFVYERFAGDAPIAARVRRRWLECQPAAHLGKDFKPQPFEQAIRVLRAMGHPEEARRLAVGRESYFMRRRLRGWSRSLGGAVRAFGALIYLLTVGLLIGYGYRPLRPIFLMVAAGFVCGAYFQLIARDGGFAPLDAQVFLDKRFEKCRPLNGGNWIDCADPGKGAGLEFAEYPKFNPWVYSFSVMLPLIDLHQDKVWGPALGKPLALQLPGVREIALPNEDVLALTNGVIVAETVFGWLASLLIVAGFSGLVKTD